MNLIRPKSLKELAVDELRQRIIDGRIALGDALSENSLASDLGISKTPVREALMQLRADGLVEIQPQRGTFVFELASDQVVAISELREVLELTAVDMGMTRHYKALVRGLTQVLDAMRTAFEAGDIASYRRLDGDYHGVIITACGNPYLKKAYGLISFQVQALRSRLSREAVLNEQSFREHVDMLGQVEAQRLPELRDLLRRHIHTTKQSYLDTLAVQEEAPREAVS